MELEVFLAIVASCCLAVLIYGYKSLWVRYRKSDASAISLGPPPPPMKKTVCGAAEIEEESNLLNEKMLQWQKLYQMATESAVEEEKPEQISEEKYSEEVNHLADVIMPGETPLSYGEYLERKLEARDTLKPVKARRKSGRAAVTPQVGRFC
jgi:hypothetical protein